METKGLVLICNRLQSLSWPVGIPRIGNLWRQRTKRMTLHLGLIFHIRGEFGSRGESILMIRCRWWSHSSRKVKLEAIRMCWISPSTLSLSRLSRSVPDWRNTYRTLVKLDNTLDANQVRIVVPSRSYSSSIKIPGKPLLGTRIAVKDIFDIKGFKTTLCSRAWTEYHEQKSETAAFVQSLIDLGAIIVGKTRLNAMVVREEPMECVEFLAPFNPRGDGYQTPAGSSTGSCVVLAAYPWLDFALGSDSESSPPPTILPLVFHS